MSRKQAIKIASNSEATVYADKEDVAYLIQLHAQLGFFEMEIFVTKKLAKSFTRVLEKRGFYTRITEFKALKDDCRLYVSWISNL